MKTNAKLFIAPLQDILSLDDESRFNKPGTISKNWKWKFNKPLTDLEPYLERFGKLGESYCRNNIF